jgi:pantetheine-phosphate adenylyltransferase
MKIAIYPGSFDPITNGHLDIIERASVVFDKIIIAVSRSGAKIPLFTNIERCEMINQSVKHLHNVEVDHFKGLLVEYAQKKNATVIIRGLRALSDFESEFRMALMNRSLEETISTFFLMPHARYTHLSSSLVREVGELKGDVSELVSEFVNKKILEKYSE